jgi:hypothetical protein
MNQSFVDLKSRRLTKQSSKQHRNLTLFKVTMRQYKMYYKQFWETAQLIQKNAHQQAGPLLKPNDSSAGLVDFPSEEDRYRNILP